MALALAIISGPAVGLIVEAIWGRDNPGVGWFAVGGWWGLMLAIYSASNNRR